MLDAEVVVVGAGVAGCATALHLARAGHDVIVLERARVAGAKVCGEGMMPDGAAELAALGLFERARVLGREFSGIGFRIGDAHAVGTFPAALRPGLGIARRQLDPLMVDACRGHPRIDLRLGVSVRSVRWHGIAEVHGEGGTISAKVLIGADGAGSTVRRHLGLDGVVRARPRFGARRHYRLRVPEPDRVEVSVGRGVEVYLTPVGRGVVNVALLLEKSRMDAFRGDASDAFLAIACEHSEVARVLQGAAPEDEVKVCGPLRQEAIDVVSDGALLVGDAAGFIDGITGEGMSLALASGRFAAEVVSGALRVGEVRASQLRPYAQRRAAYERDARWLTEVVLWGIRHPRLAERVVAGLARRPDRFGRLLAVNARAAPLGFSGLAALLWGR